MDDSRRSRLPLALLCLLGAVAAAAAGVYLWTVHREHLGGLAFYALALGCVLMHVLGHRGRHAHVHAGPAQGDGSRKRLG